MAPIQSREDHDWEVSWCDRGGWYIIQHTKSVHLSQVKAYARFERTMRHEGRRYARRGLGKAPSNNLKDESSSNLVSIGYSKNDAWSIWPLAKESLLNENPNGWMFEVFQWDNQNMGQFPMDVSKQAKRDEVSWDMWWHHGAWVVLLKTEMTMRCNVVYKRSLWVNKLDLAKRSYYREQF